MTFSSKSDILYYSNMQERKGENRVRIREYREKARQALQGNWGKAIGTGVLSVLLGAGITGLGSSGGGAYCGDARNGLFPVLFFILGLMGYSLSIGDLGVLLLIFALMGILELLMLVMFFIGGGTSIGYAKYNLALVRGENPGSKVVFSGFKQLDKGFFMQFQRLLMIVLWSLLFIIPGYVAACSYSMTPYILVEHPELTAREAMKHSRQMMQGRKGKFFLLQLSFAGWSLLGLLTLGIGYFWVGPYEETATAVFYEEIVKEEMRQQGGMKGVNELLW